MLKGLPEKYLYRPLPKELTIKNGQILVTESIMDVILDECYAVEENGALVLSGAFKFLKYSDNPNCSLVKDGERYKVSIDEPLTYGEILTINTPKSYDYYNPMSDGFVEVKESEIEGLGLFWKGIAREIFTHVEKHRLWTGAYINHSDTPNSTLVADGKKYLKVLVGDLKIGQEITVNYNNSPCGSW